MVSDLWESLTYDWATVQYGQYWSKWKSFMWNKKSFETIENLGRQCKRVKGLTWPPDNSKHILLCSNIYNPPPFREGYSSEASRAGGGDRYRPGGARDGEGGPGHPEPVQTFPEEEEVEWLTNESQLDRRRKKKTNKKNKKKLSADVQKYGRWLKRRFWWLDRVIMEFRFCWFIMQSVTIWIFLHERKWKRRKENVAV